jgi:hypothetical protein
MRRPVRLVVVLVSMLVVAWPAPAQAAPRVISVVDFD